MSRLKELEEKAIARLQAFAPMEDQEPYYIAYSGGKDSDTIRILAELSGVRYELHHNLTTVDAPETVYYVRSIPDIIIHRPERSMWQLIPEKLMPPTRIVRYCCAELKERGGQGRRVVTGVRVAESVKRKRIPEIVGKGLFVRSAKKDAYVTLITARIVMRKWTEVSRSDKAGTL